MKKPTLILILLSCISLAKAQHSDERPVTKADTAEQFFPVDKIPEFPGGIGKFAAYLEKNRNKKIKTEGRVLVTFVVEKDGSLTDIKVLRSLSPEADTEAIRLIANSPKWNPGMQNNRPVRVQYNMPVMFK